jgi:hypothetical protein
VEPKSSVLLLLLTASLVSANEGYMPITIFEDGKYSYAYCKFGEPCKYLQGAVVNGADSHVPGEFGYFPYYLMAGFAVSAAFVVIISYQLIKWVNPK